MFLNIIFHQSPGKSLGVRPPSAPGEKFSLYDQDRAVVWIIFASEQTSLKMSYRHNCNAR
jgi:hypothetical protein